MKIENFAFNKVDWKTLNEAIVNDPFMPYCFSNVDELLKQWYTWFNRILTKNVPKVTKHRSNLPTWIKPETSNLIKIISTLKRKIAKRSNILRLMKLKKKEHSLRRKMLEDQTEYEEKVFKGRQFSDVQKYLRSVYKNNRFPETMKYKKQTSNDDATKAKYFSDFFSSVFNKTDQISEKQSYEKQLFNKINIDETKIKQILKKLRTNKARGPDKIGNRILKNLPALSKSLLILFQTALSKGFFPTYWKISEVVPIFKDDDKSSVEQYRPISLLCNISKVLEKLIYDELYEIVKQKLDNSQHGFRKQRSVVTQMLMFLDHLYSCYDTEDKELYVLYLDFKKAFDSVPHQPLLNKIKELGIGGNFLKIIASYLTNRKQYVRLNNEKSETVKVTSGVPQGSLLGPLLFIIYVNDLPKCTTNCQAFGYADDYKLVTSKLSDLQKDVDSIEDWCKTKKMTLNEDKCYILPVKDHKEVSNISLNSKILQEKTQQKDLGLIMSKKINWKANAKRRCRKAWKSYYFLKRNMSAIASVKTKLNGYVGYVVPVVSYASQAWKPNKTEAKEIEKIQKRATAWILNTWDMKYKDRLSKLNLLPLTMYFELHDLLLYINFLEGKYNIKVPQKLIERKIEKTDKMKTRNQKLELPNVEKTRTRKADENFWKRSSQLYSMIKKEYNQNETLNKSIITKLYWNYFSQSYDADNSCSWILFCACGHCNPVQKIRGAAN